MSALTLRWVPHSSPDYLALVELRRAVLRIPLGLNFTADQLAAESTQLHLGAWDGDRLAGCLVLRLDEPGIVRMRQVAVSPDVQRSGVGRALVIESEAEARRRGLKKMTLNARNTAVPFYRRLGYTGEGDLFPEVGIPHLFMTKAL